MLKREIEQGNRAVKGNREYWGVEGRLQFLVGWLGKVILEPRLDGGMVQSSLRKASLEEETITAVKRPETELYLHIYGTAKEISVAKAE